mmetsp:Transcript_4357/g.9868  ORF Transcript_4357/g.9868 Transcript_4357/m.9868 type:complete len:247 (+) Transcript_4357:84-824(+)
MNSQDVSGVGAVAAAAARSARPASAEADDYSDLASLPTPNKGKFGKGVPGEMQVGNRVPKQILHYLISAEGGRIIETTAHGSLFEAASRRQKQEQREEENDSDDMGAGCYAPKISIEGSRTMACKRKENFSCDGMMYRHTDVSWEDAPIEFKRPHEVEAKKGSPAESICYEHKIEDLMPFDCDVYWKTIWEKCMSCHEADQKFKRWAMRASTPGAIVVRKKRQADDKAEGQGKAKAQKGNLKSEEL